METTILKTATELERESAQKMERARLYEVLIAEDEQAQKAFDYYRRVLSEPDADVVVASTIAEAASTLSERHVTKGGMLRPGGYNLRALILEEIGHVLAKAKAARASLENRLPDIELRAEEARRALDSFLARTA